MGMQNGMWVAQDFLIHALELKLCENVVDQALCKGSCLLLLPESVETFLISGVSRSLWSSYHMAKSQWLLFLPVQCLLWSHQWNQKDYRLWQKRCNPQEVVLTHPFSWRPVDSSGEGSHSSSIDFPDRWLPWKCTGTEVLEIRTDCKRHTRIVGTVWGSDHMSDFIWLMKYFFWSC